MPSQFLTEMVDHRVYFGHDPKRMSFSSPFLPPNPLYPRPCGEAVAEGMKQQINGAGL